MLILSLFTSSKQSYLSSGDWDDVEDLEEKLESYKSTSSAIWNGSLVWKLYIVIKSVWGKIPEMQTFTILSECVIHDSRFLAPM